jgi:hypothetical protein
LEDYRKSVFKNLKKIDIVNISIFILERNYF